MKLARYIILSALLLVQCDHSEMNTKPAHTGSPGEIVVITPDSVWQNGLEKTFYDLFAYYVPMLPQAEAAFAIGHYTPAQFSMIIERHRNIAWVDINPKLEKNTGTLRVVKDKWAKAQLVIEIEAGSIEKAIELINDQGENLAQLINKKENERLAARFRVYSSPPLIELVKRKFDVDMVIPDGFEMALDSAGFFWLHREKSKTSGGMAYYVIQNLVMYYIPYDSDSSFTEANLLQWRDRYVKHITSKAKGSYLTTVYKFEDMDLYPIGRDVVVDGQYGRLIRGLWKMENDFMGGPFVSLATYDERKQKILVVEGHVFAPKFDKKEYLREMEALLFSLHFPKTNSDS